MIAMLVLLSGCVTSESPTAQWSAAGKRTADSAYSQARRSQLIIGTGY
jgi:hypothetical protein